MPEYKARDADSYGHAIGILMLEYRAPFIPGDVGNASSYDYPVLFKTVAGLSLDKALSGDPDQEEQVIDAARELQRFGVRGVSSDCGFLIAYQDAVRKALDVPVFLSSLLQVPLVAASVDGPIGVVVASSGGVNERVLELAGVRDPSRIVVCGMENQPHFTESILEQGGTLDSDRIERETVDSVQRMVAANPGMGAIVLECSLLPPYSRAVQEATGLPVFDYITMIDYFQAGTHQQRYYGLY
ncbi:MAG TPA: aspartate/glutamate racemase family protein [Arenicellales bacterium]|nr:aspartate/glutamate racemase family protein [Arenicellales bacterium]